MANLGERLRGHDNAINFLRLVMATYVIFGHARAIGAFPAGWEPGGGFGEWPVAGFFVLSGYLITASRNRMSMKPYLWRRFLRIMPGYWVCLIITAFVAAPVGALLAGEVWQPGSAASFVATNSLLFQAQTGVDATLLGVAFPGVWNGSLWPLLFEFIAYLAAGAAISLAVFRRYPVRILLVALTLACVSTLDPRIALKISYITDVGYLKSFVYAGSWLASFFIAGMIAWYLRDRLRSSWVLAVASAVLLAGISLLGGFYAFAALPLAYLLVYLGGALPVRLGAKNDISYGVYIYAWPVQVLLFLVGAHHLGLLAYQLLAIVGTVPLAWLSWKLVEEPMMRFRHLVPEPRKPLPTV